MVQSHQGNVNARAVYGVNPTTGAALADPAAPVLAAGENHIGAVGGALKVATGTFARPADTTAYAANDVVSNNTTTTTPITAAGVARVAGGSGYIVAARLWTDKKSIVPRFRVHLFNAVNPTLSGDNLPYQNKYADVGKRIASFDLAAMSTPADTTNSDMSGITDFTLRIPFVAVASDIYAVLETLDIFTPASAENFVLVLVVDQN